MARTLQLARLRTLHARHVRRRSCTFEAGRSKRDFRRCTFDSEFHEGLLPRVEAKDLRIGLRAAVELEVDWQRGDGLERRVRRVQADRAADDGLVVVVLAP